MTRALSPPPTAGASWHALQRHKVWFFIQISDTGLDMGSERRAQLDIEDHAPLRDDPSFPQARWPAAKRVLHGLTTSKLVTLGKPQTVS